MSNAEESKKAIIDMRSDTVTKPTEEMRHAMAHADVGDDVFGDDATVNRLEKETAAMIGKEAALFVPSGTMGNLIAAIVHCDRFGSEMILGNESHMHVYEQGGCATLGHVHPRPIRTQPDGTLDLADIEAAIRPNDVHAPITRLVCLENTHNRMGGRVLTAEYIDSVGALTKRHGLQLHIDGARIFNAAVFLGIPVSRLVQAADTICVCLSKGLAAPVGSVLCGPASFIAQARRVRKALGGGMRQAGILAAAGLISINKSVERLAEDHAHAKSLAESLASIPGLKLDPATVQTNIVFVDLETTKVSVDGKAVADRLKAANILAVATGPYRIRFVTNYHHTPASVETVVVAMKAIIADVTHK